MNTGYLIVLEDTHADPEFRFRWNRGEAITEAKNAVAEAATIYKLSDGDIEYSGCNGQHGFWFSAQSPCGSFHVSVREILIPPLDN